MLKQYNELKQENKDAILLFRLGDFYEMFNEDAIKASKILNITLTARHKGKENETPMCGVPHHAAESYIAKLTQAGEKVAVCEQVSDPSDKGIVEREVVRVITPGTTLSDEVLDNKKNNYIASIFRKKNTWGMALADFTTGEFLLTEFEKSDALAEELTRLTPSEIITTPGLAKDEETATFLKHFSFHTFLPSSWPTPEERLKEFFHINDFHQLGLKEYEVGLEAAANLLSYLQETQKTDLHHINRLRYYNCGEYMLLDESTMRNLEIFRTAQTGEYKGSLLSVIDKTQTAMGGRMLANWLLRPLQDKKKIQNRLDAVEVLVKETAKRKKVRELLNTVSDVERLLARIGCGRCTPRDIIALKHSLMGIPALKKELEGCNAELLIDFYNNTNEHKELLEFIDVCLMSDPPANMSNGGYIADGYHAELDELRSISRSGKDWIAKMQQEEIEKTGITSLKVKFNKVFGYYIEVSKSNLNAVPENYIRKQTLVNAERFITPELKEYEEKVLGAQEKILVLEMEIFESILKNIHEHMKDLQDTASRLARLDVLSSLAYLAVLNRFEKPTMVDGNALEIVGGRHPVIEEIQAGQYIANDLSIGKDGQKVILLTGPNMSGKSSYLRQNAIIVLLAHIGSHVPASTAKIPIVDRIFTRVGASDNLAQGRSTFMVEMQEAANIIHNASEKSLLILDELGRGTSTFDGVSIAWAVLEYLHNQLGAKTLFATHYHELIEVTDDLSHAKNYFVAVKENEDEGVVFLRQVKEGGIDKSYGIAVAQLAGMPEVLIKRAQSILKQLENGDGKKQKQMSLPLASEEFVEKKHPVIEELESLDPNDMTPLQALQKIEELRKRLS